MTKMKHSMAHYQTGQLTGARALVTAQGMTLVALKRPDIVTTNDAREEKMRAGADLGTDGAAPKAALGGL